MRLSGADNLDHGRVRTAWWHRAGLPALPLHFAAFDCAQFDPHLLSDAQWACLEPVAHSVRKRQAEYYYGRLCARAAMAYAALGSHVIGVGASREPLWPPEVIGSITHSPTLASAVALRSGAVSAIGIDIEHVLYGDALEAVLEMATSAHERQLLHSCVGQLPWSVLVTLLFSAKESFFKAAFSTVGYYFDFDAIELESVDLVSATFRFRHAIALGSRYPQGAPCEVGFAVIDPLQVMTACIVRAD